MIQGLYAITDAELIAPKRFKSKVQQVLEGGAKVVQYRDKSHHHQLRIEQATILVNLCRQYKAISIINDDVELAKIVRADGVHIGLEDEGVLEARQSLGEKVIIGASCYADLELADKAVADSADYVAFGSIFPSSTKPSAKIAGLDIISQAKKKMSVPVVAIGGIDLHNAADVIAAGADSIALISALFAGDDVRQSAEQFTDLFIQP